MAQPVLHIQGLVNLIDNFELDGGFQLVPGFHHHVKDWAFETKNTLGVKYARRQTFCMLPQSTELQNYALRVTARAGSMVLWNQTVLHGSKCNESDNFRMAQFIKVFPAPPSLDTPRFQRRKQVVQAKVLESQVPVTELGKQVFGLE